MIKLIKNVKIYRDGDWKDSQILISGSQIEEVSDSIELSYPGLETVDGQGMRAIPGYIDQHVHVCGGGGEGSFITQVPSLKLTDPVKSGVTTLVGLLGTDGTTRSVENLVAKTKALNEFGMTAYCLTGSYYFPSPTITGSVMDDMVFIDEVIGCKIAICDHRSSNMSMEELRRLASQVRVAGLLAGKPGILTLHTGSGADKLGIIFDVLKNSEVPVSTFRPTHLGNKYDDAIKFAKMGGYIDFTTDPDEIEKTAAQVIQAMDEAPDGLVTFSTDSNGSMPIWNDKHEMIGIGAGRISALHDCVKSMVEQGCPLEKAILPVTRNAAKALGKYPVKGFLGAGADADIVLLDDQLNVDTVFAKGKCMVSGGKLQVKANFEE